MAAVGESQIPADPQVSDLNEVEPEESSDDDVGGIIEKNCSDRTRGTYWIFTHFLHALDGQGDKECEAFPCDCASYKIRSTYKVLGGGYEVEVCPKSKKKHHQGWMYLDREIPFEQLKTMFCHKVHWAKMAGSVAQNIKYCSKDGKYVGFGNQDTENCHLRVGKGQRNDLAAVVEASESGMSTNEIARKFPVQFIKYPKGIMLHHEIVQPEYEERPRRFIVFWGQTGSGKSWGARHIIGDDSVYLPEKNNASHLSFEIYSGQKWILIEEFKGLGLFCDDLKTYVDRYAVELRGRGSSKKGLHIGVIITSQCDPMSWYPDQSEEDSTALLRRMTGLYQCHRDKWLNQLTGESYDNPCPYVSQAPAIRTFAQLPRLPSASSASAISNSTFLFNNKKRKFGKHFPPQENAEVIDLR